MTVGIDEVEQTRPELATHNTALGTHDTDLKADIGDFSARSNLTTLLASLGIPDTTDKPLYTCLIADRLDHATFGLSAAQVLIAALQTDLDNGTDGLGALKALIDTANTSLGHGTYGLSALQVLIAALQTDLDNGTDGLGALKALIDTATTNIGTANTALAHGTYGLSALQVLIAALQTDLDNGTDGLGALKALIDTANTSLGHGTYGLSALQVLIAALQTDLDNGTDGLGALKALIDTMQGNVTSILGDTETNGVVLGTKVAAYKLLVGENQIAVTTEDLNQVAGSYDLLTGTTQPVALTALSIKMPDDLCSDATLTSISVQTDDTTPGVIISAASGAVANLTAEAELSWTGWVRINAGTKIRLTIAGGAEGAEYITTITAKCEAIVDGGYLAA